MRRIGLAAALLALPLAGAGTAVWEMSTWKDFLGGVFQNVSLSREGRLALGPELQTVFASEQPLLWAMARGTDGSIYLGAGHRGRVFRVDRNGKSSLLWTAPEPEVFALVAAPDGSLYAGTSPDGKIYKITASGQASEFFHPQSKYIWSLVVGRDGALYAGTGERGRIFRIDASGKGELYYDTRQGHVTSLALDGSGALLAGTDPNGILYRVSAAGKAFVLHDSPLAEVRSIEVTADGTIYAAAMGGTAARLQQPGAATAGAEIPLAPVTTSITVTAAAEPAQQLPKPVEAPKPPAAPAAPSAAAPAPAAPIPGAQRSALLRINTDNTVETLWSSAEENVYAVLPVEGGLLFSTDDHGRIYRLEPGRPAALVAQTGEEETTRLAAVGDAVLALTSNLGKLYRLGRTPAATGRYEAPVRDAGNVSRWGRLSWRAEAPPGAAIEFYTRSGNSTRPDDTWSEWAGPLRNPEGETVRSPSARYIQWRAEFRGPAGGAPVLESVSLPYLPQNTAPSLNSILVVPTAQPAKAPATPASATSTADFSITVTDTGAPANPGTTTASVGRSAAQSQAVSVSWQAEDPDGDKLTAQVWFRGQGESRWKLLRENVAESYLTIDSDALADGVYQVKVMVSDAPSNPAPAARAAEMISAPFLLDNTPPAARSLGVERSGDRAVVRFEARDSASIVRRAEYSLDAGPWTPLWSDDGISDSKVETFAVILEKLSPGEHLVTLRVLDAAGNAGLAKAVVR